MNKVFQQEIVQDNPFPGEILEQYTPSSATNVGEFTPSVSQNKPFPIKRTAVELLATALNTRSRKILEAFELQQSGGFQIGNFKEGLTGDLRITPNGITARDISGLITFLLDGTDGSAIFRGEVRAGSIITGEVIVGDNRVIIDGENKQIIINDGSNDRILIGYQKDGF